jgi:hypothetical protein
MDEETKFMSSHTPRPETLALHAGWRADPATGAVAVPIVGPQITTPRGVLNADGQVSPRVSIK